MQQSRSSEGHRQLISLLTIAVYQHPLSLLFNRNYYKCVNVNNPGCSMSPCKNNIISMFALVKRHKVKRIIIFFRNLFKYMYISLVLTTNEGPRTHINVIMTHLSIDSSLIFSNNYPLYPFLENKPCKSRSSGLSGLIDNN